MDPGALFIEATAALPKGPVRTDGRALGLVARNTVCYLASQSSDPKDQDRFWYFREVGGLRGWATAEGGIIVEPQVTVAGDVYNLGLGRVFALSSPSPDGPQLRLTVLADTGGAFQPNLFQLDWLAGTYPSHDAFKAAVAEVPPYVRADVLVVREGVEVRPGACAPALFTDMPTAPAP